MTLGAEIDALLTEFADNSTAPALPTVRFEIDGARILLTTLVDDGATESEIVAPVDAAGSIAWLVSISYDGAFSVSEPVKSILSPPSMTSVPADSVTFGASLTTPVAVLFGGEYAAL